MPLVAKLPAQLAGDQGGVEAAWKQDTVRNIGPHPVELCFRAPVLRLFYYSCHHNVAVYNVGILHYV